MIHKILAISLGVVTWIGEILVEPALFNRGRAGVASAEEKNPMTNTHPTYTQLRPVSLSGEYSSVENLVLKRDTGTITFRQGHLYFLAPVDGRITGAVFIGDGEFQMTPTLSIEQRYLGLLTGTPSITEKFSKMVLRFSDSTYDEVKKASGTLSGAPNAGARDALDDNRRLLRKGKIYSRPNVAAGFLSYNLDARILMDLTALAAQGLFHAYFNGKRFGDMLFAIDPLGAPFVTPEEVVVVCFAEDSLGIWTAQHLKEHYRSEAVFSENHQPIDLEHYKIDATAKGKRLDASVEARFKAATDGARVLPFDLFPRLRMRSVKDAQGRELHFIQESKDDDPNFAVILNEGLKKGQEYTLKFEYGGDDALEDSGGGNYTLAARENWYPFSYFGDRATYEMTIRTPKGLTMVATGQPVSQSDEKDQTITTWKSEVPLAVAGFNYGKFKSNAVTDEKLKYRIETYANRELPEYLRALQRDIELREREEGVTAEATLGSLNTVSLIDKARNEAQVSMNLYTDMFGALPYGRIAMTQQPYFNFGQAWPMLVYMPLMAYLDSTHRHQLGLDAARNFVRYVAAHEVAHQWWGHVIGWKSYRDQWMSEGFSEFSASVFAQLVYKNDKFVDFWKEQRQFILEKNQFGKRPSDVGGVYMGYRLDNAKTGYVTRATIYPKGAFILHMLRMLMWDSKTGDARFSAMMKDFVKTYYNQNVSTQDFWHVVEKHMTKEMDLDGNGKMSWFFAQWVYGTSIPDYKLEYRVDPADGGQFKLIGKLTQSNVEESFKMRVPIYIDYDGKLARLGSSVIYGNSTTPEFSVVLPKKPRKVILCALEDVLCTTSNR